MGLLAVVTALTSAFPAGASLLPVERTFGELTVPRVRTGTLQIPRNQDSGRVRLIVGLPLPPLAASYGRSFAAQSGARKLNVSSASSRAYLARVEASQQAASSGDMAWLLARNYVMRNDGPPCNVAILSGHPTSEKEVSMPSITARVLLVAAASVLAAQARAQDAVREDNKEAVESLLAAAEAAAGRTLDPAFREEMRQRLSAWARKS